jgi:hypothetical protein
MTKDPVRGPEWLEQDTSVGPPEHEAEGEQREVSWIMPEWMEPFRNLIEDTNGASVEDVMNRLMNGRSSDVQVMRTVCVTAQVNLLYRLHREGKL